MRPTLPLLALACTCLGLPAAAPHYHTRTDAHPAALAPPDHQQQQQITLQVTGAQLSRSSTREPASPGDSPTSDIASDGTSAVRSCPSAASLGPRLTKTENQTSPQALLDQARTLLAALTRAAPPSPPTQYTPHRAPSSVLDAVGGPLARLARSAHRVRARLARLVDTREPVSANPAATRRRIERWKHGHADRLPVKASPDDLAEGMHEVVRLCEEAADAGVPAAALLLANLYLSGHLTLAPDPNRALELFTRASEHGGLPEAQYKLGFLYGSNYGAAVSANEGIGSQGSALLHYTFAALSGHVPASMTVGYRHWVGIGAKQSCKEALGWYKAAADEAMRTFNAGPPGGRLLPPPKIRLSDLKGGAYGPGASASSRPHVTGGSTSQTQQEWDDLIEFHLFHAERGDTSYMFRLGRLYYQGFGASGAGGSRGGQGRLNVALPGLQDKLAEGGRDFRRASTWFMAVARGMWKTDGKPVPPAGHYDPAKDVKQKDVKQKDDDHFAMVAGLAAGYLGRMYLRGEGVRVDYNKAYLWFSRGSGQSDRESTNGLGIMYRDALGVPRDLQKANTLFAAAAQQDLADAQVNLGKYHFGIGEWAVATTYFEHAIRYDGGRQPDTFQAYYYLAELQARAANRADQCPHAVSFYKVVAERGDWDHEVWWEAERALARGDERTALLGYWIMAERGYEAAQNNLAFILDRDTKRLRLPLLDPAPASNVTDRLALAYWTRSAAQDNVDALVKMGDYYFNGIGVEAGAGPQLERAAACYQSAVTARVSAMAMWNLGWMHENGRGVVKDFHLAKRYYDMALETSADAYLPATLSLISLYARSLYNTFFGTDDGLKSLSLFARPLVEEPDPGHTGSTQESDDPTQAPPAAAWSLGRAWREMQRRWGLDVGPEGVVVEGDLAAAPAAAPPPTGGGPTDDVAQAQRALQAQEDPLDWARRAREGAPDDDEQDEYFLLDGGDGDFAGTLAIVVLCAVLGWLLYFRQGPALQPPARAPPLAAPVPVPPPPPAVPRGDGEGEED